MKETKYEFNTKEGFLNKVVITTTETIKSKYIQKGFLDTRFLELLLNVDERWKTIRQTMKGVSADITSSEVKKVFKRLCELGLIQKRKISNKHVEYCRTKKFPTHLGMGK